MKNSNLYRNFWVRKSKVFHNNHLKKSTLHKKVDHFPAHAARLHGGNQMLAELLNRRMPSRDE